jgi:hypothetical protein
MVLNCGLSVIEDCIKFSGVIEDCIKFGDVIVGVIVGFIILLSEVLNFFFK